MPEKTNTASKKDILKKIIKLIGKYNVFLVMSLLFALISVLTTLYIPVLTGQAVDLIIEAGKVDFGAIKHILFKMAVMIIITGLSQWLMNICGNKITFNVVQELRRKAFAKLQRLPLKYTDSHMHGETVSRLISDVDQFSDGLLLGFTQLFSGVVTIMATIVFMLSINLYITLVVVLITPLSLFAANFIAKKTYSLFRLQSETKGEQTAFIEEMIGGQKVVQAFGYEKEAMDRFDEINGRLQKHSLRAIFYSATANPATRFVNGMVYAGVGIAGAFLAIPQIITVGNLSCFLSYANQYTKPFNEISGVVTELQNAIACASRIFELIDEQEETPDPADAFVPEEFDGSVSLQNVFFSYSPDAKLIENFNLDVKENQKIAIVGPTGCGKTTVINLLMRFYDTDKGTISVSGADIKKMPRSSLRSAYGMVLQDTWLMNASVRENIAMGKPDASLEEIKAAAKASHAHGFIKRLPNGYDTIINENGDGLSQGQKQLLCIARVMLCLPPMLILDEATSSIDTRTEAKIQDAFAEMMKGRTSFIVAHRLSTVKEADIILVMRNGRIIEQGKHKELLDKKGFYYTLYNSQFAAL